MKRPYVSLHSVVFAILLGVLIGTYFLTAGCARPYHPKPRHDAPFSVLPPEHLKSLAESARQGR